MFTQFSFPGGIPSHVAPKLPARSTKAANWAIPWRMPMARLSTIPDLLVACVVGDGEAETGPLATSWHSNKFLNPVHDGAVLPILHLNGYKIAGPTVLARIPHEELEQLFRGYGYHPYFVEGDDPEEIHQLMAGTLDADRCRNQSTSRTKPAPRVQAAAALADDHSAHAERLDGSEGG